MQIMNQQQQEVPSTAMITAQNLQKIQLINANLSHFKKLVKISVVAAFARMGFFLMVLVNQQTFISSQSNHADGWSVIFYILASLMDFLVVLNEVQILKLVRKESVTLEEVKRRLASNSPEIVSTMVGPYNVYLSISSIINVYKLHPRPMTSITQTVKYLEAIITFFVFGNLAISSQYTNSAPLFPTFLLWLFIVSVYLTVFQLDILTVEAASGVFVETRTEVWEMAEESWELQLVKDNYIKRIRRPFQIVYLVSILLLLAIIVLYPNLSLLTFMLSLCIGTLIIELIFEKHMQNTLIITNLSAIPKQHLTPALIRHHLANQSRFTHTSITTATRLSAVLLLMAYFRTPTDAMQSLLVLLVCVCMVAGQKLKHGRAERGKVYLLEGRTQGEGGGECSICLLNCERGDRVLVLPCFANHVFHLRCLKKWLKERRECPLCRQSLQHYDICD